MKILDVKVERPKELDTDLARQLLADIDQGKPSKGYEADFKRIQRVAGMVNKYEEAKRNTKRC